MFEREREKQARQSPFIDARAHGAASGGSGCARRHANLREGARNAAAASNDRARVAPFTSRAAIVVLQLPRPAPLHPTVSKQAWPGRGYLGCMDVMATASRRQRRAPFALHTPLQYKNEVSSIPALGSLVSLEPSPWCI